MGDATVTVATQKGTLTSVAIPQGNECIGDVFYRRRIKAKTCPTNKDNEVFRTMSEGQVLCIDECDGFWDCGAKILAAVGGIGHKWECPAGFTVPFGAYIPGCIEICKSNYNPAGPICTTLGFSYDDVLIIGQFGYCVGATRMNALTNELVSYHSAFNTMFERELKDLAILLEYGLVRPWKDKINSESQLQTLMNAVMNNAWLMDHIDRFMGLIIEALKVRRRRMAIGLLIPQLECMSLEFNFGLPAVTFGFGIAWDIEDGKKGVYTFTAKGFVSDFELVQIGASFQHWTGCDKIAGQSMESSGGKDKNPKKTIWPLITGANVGFSPGVGGEITLVTSPDRMAIFPNLVKSEFLGFGIGASASVGISPIDIGFKLAETTVHW